jgi:hypothetical protein
MRLGSAGWLHTPLPLDLHCHDRRWCEGCRGGREVHVVRWVRRLLRLLLRLVLLRLVLLRLMHALDFVRSDRGRSCTSAVSNGDVQAGDDSPSLRDEDFVRHAGCVDADPGAVSSSIVQLGAPGLWHVDVAVGAECLQETVVKRAAGDFLPWNGSSGGVREEILDQGGMENGGAPEFLWEGRR